MMRFSCSASIAGFFLLGLLSDQTSSLCSHAKGVREPQNDNIHQTRRGFLGYGLALGGFSSLGIAPFPAIAAADCMTDCLKNCKKIAPKDTSGYCQMNCEDYCAQDDRNDGLSGSVSASSGEVGILGGTFGQGTVPKGEDRPPSVRLPGLDFTSSSGKKLLGY